MKSLPTLDVMMLLVLYRATFRVLFCFSLKLDKLNITCGSFKAPSPTGSIFTFLLPSHHLVIALPSLRLPPALPPPPTHLQARLYAYIQFVRLRLGNCNRGARVPSFCFGTGHECRKRGGVHTSPSRRHKLSRVTASFCKSIF